MIFCLKSNSCPLRHRIGGGGRTTTRAVKVFYANYFRWKSWECISLLRSCYIIHRQCSAASSVGTLETSFPDGAVEITVTDSTMGDSKRDYTNICNTVFRGFSIRSRIFRSRIRFGRSFCNRFEEWWGIPAYAAINLRRSVHNNVTPLTTRTVPRKHCLSLSRVRSRSFGWGPCRRVGRAIVHHAAMTADQQFHPVESVLTPFEPLNVRPSSRRPHCRTRQLTLFANITFSSYVKASELAVCPPLRIVYTFTLYPKFTKNNRARWTGNNFFPALAEKNQTDFGYFSCDCDHFLFCFDYALWSLCDWWEALDNGLGNYSATFMLIGNWYKGQAQYFYATVVTRTRMRTVTILSSALSIVVFRHRIVCWNMNNIQEIRQAGNYYINKIGKISVPTHYFNKFTPDHSNHFANNQIMHGTKSIGMRDATNF